MNVYQTITASGRKTYQIESDDTVKALKTPTTEQPEEMTTNEKIITISILVVLAAFVVFIFPDVTVLLIFVLFSGGSILLIISMVEIFNTETRIGGKSYYPWANGSPAELSQQIKAYRKERFANNRICNICGDKLSATQTTCQCGHIVNCIICYQPIYKHAIVFDCCFSSIHRSHLTSITASCPYCKTKMPRFMDSGIMER